MSKSARPDLKFHSIAELIADADKLRTGKYEKAGQWDLATILDHLAKGMGSPFKPGEKNLPWPLSGIARFVMHRFAQRQAYPAIKLPVPKAMKPTPGIGLATAYDDFIGAARQLEAASGETIQVPAIGTIKLDDFKKIQLLHGAHHLSFLKLVE